MGLSTSVTQGRETGTTISGTTGSKTDINRLADVLEKKYQDSHDIKEENIGKWDATTKTGISQEVITRYDNMKDPNFIMTKTEMKKFRNTLTLSKNCSQTRT